MEDTETDPESITYTYTYNGYDQLEEVDAVINEVTTCVQQFDYDVNLDNDSGTDDKNIIILDAEERITVIKEEELKNGNHIVSSVYEPVKIDEQNLTIAGYLQSVNYYAFDIDDVNNITTVTNNHGVSVTYAFNENGLLVSKTDAEGHSIVYEHDSPYSEYLVTAMSYDNTLNGEENPTTIKYTYDYNSDGNITQIKAWSREYGAGSFVALGPQTDYTYDPNHPNKVSTVTI